MVVPGKSALKVILQKATAKIYGGACVLYYHRINELPSDPHRLCVTQQHFEEHLQVIRKKYHALSLDDLLKALQTGRVPARSVVVTFDDGYADNLYNAKPLLEQYDIPAAFFIATGFIGGRREYFWDELEQLILCPEKVPPALHFRQYGVEIHWEVSAEKESTRGSKERTLLYNRIHAALKTVCHDKRTRIIDFLAGWTGHDVQYRDNHRQLSEAEIIELAKGGLCDIGAHTVHHEVLAQLAAVDQEREITQSKLMLENILGRPVHFFSYPRGKRIHYNAETIALVRKAGFLCACTTEQGLASSRSDLFSIPRFGVGDYDGDTFAERLQNLFRGLW